MNNKELALYAAKVLDAKKAKDITIIDIAEKSNFADYFVIASASNLRQLASLSDECADKLLEAEAEVKHVEGKGDSGWILIDAGDIIVNLFTDEQRDKYQIEKVWSDCPRVEYESQQAEV